MGQSNGGTGIMTHDSPDSLGLTTHDFLLDSPRDSCSADTAKFQKAGQPPSEAFFIGREREFPGDSPTPRGRGRFPFGAWQISGIFHFAVKGSLRDSQTLRR
jgi:hypothetical protein